MERAFAIGETTDRNALNYSDYGSFATWPANYFLRIGVNTGDWPSKLESSGDWIAIFKQNSLYILTGASFYQYTIQKISGNIGCVAPKSTERIGPDVFFVHTSGVYSINQLRQAVQQPTPLSYPVQNIFDSARSNIETCWGGGAAGEYWLSIPIGGSTNNRTLIYAMTPQPHWKSYTLGFKSQTYFDTSSTVYDFDPTRWVLLGANDSMYQWGTLENDTASTDGGASFTSAYRSKFFNDDEYREKVYYMDIEGDGATDSLEVVLYDWNLSDTALIDTISVDFTERKSQRLPINKIVRSLAIQISDFGDGDQWTLEGYSVGWIPWDKGKAQ